jgi:hypothetical protein
MKVRTILLLGLFLWSLVAHDIAVAGGITPEQIYQASIEWAAVVGTWEVLPEDSPLIERESEGGKLSHRTLMTLRKDGTCRIFNGKHPLGEDGTWTSNDHDMSIRFKTGLHLDLYIYGVKGDFMITRAEAENGTDQLWSRVK